MGVLTSLLSCLGCSDGASAPAQAQAQAAPPSSSSPPPRKSDQRHRRSASQQSHHKKPKPKPPAGPSRQSSRHKLDLPLEYCQDPDDDPEDSIIMGRKASYSLGDTQSSSRATSRANSSSNLLGLANDTESYHTITPDDFLGSGAQEVRLLHKQPRRLKGRKTLVLDLDETLVHSSFKFMPDADFIIPVEIEGRNHNVYVAKRPGVDEFLKQVGALFEVVVFTASVAKYGDPLLDHLDIHKVVHHRLFRESCYNLNGNYIKNLSQLGRPLKDTIIIDNSPASYALQPQNAVPVSSWFSDVHDNELLAMMPFLSALAKPAVNDVCVVLDVYIGD